MSRLIRDNAIFFWIFLGYIITLAILIFSTEKGDFLLFWNAHHTDFQTGLFKILTRVGEAGAFLTAVFILLFYSYKKAINIAVSGLVALPVVQFLKYFFSHPRPMKYFENMGFANIFDRLDGVAWLTGSNSFPSGHTTAAFVLMASLSFCSINKKWSLLWIFLAILTGLSRIYLRHHFLEDVLFGSILGLGIAILVYGIFEPRDILIRGKSSLRA